MPHPLTREQLKLVVHKLTRSTILGRLTAHKCMGISHLLPLYLGGSGNLIVLIKEVLTAEGGTKKRRQTMHIFSLLLLFGWDQGEIGFNTQSPVAHIRTCKYRVPTKYPLETLSTKCTITCGQVTLHGSMATHYPLVYCVPCT